MIVESWWAIVAGRELMQGDLLPDCGVPVVPPDFDPRVTADSSQSVDIQVRDLIVITQSCDLVNAKLSVVATCSTYTLADYEKANPDFVRKGVWDEVRKGRIEGLHMLASPATPDDNSQALVADFREIFSLPMAYLSRIADEMG